jgi:hypothetical protein
MTGHRDLLIITPSRGRPMHAARLARAIEKTAVLDVELVVCVDDDDPLLSEYEAIDEPMSLFTGKRQPISAITNDLAVRHAANFEFLGQYSDDHIPRTHGWDAELCSTIDRMPHSTGMAYAEGSRWVIPEGIIMSADIVTALGYLSLPCCRHYKLDDAWLQLGLAAGCIRYRPDVLIEHMQYQIPRDILQPELGNKALADQTYAVEQERFGEDVAAWVGWLRDPAGFQADAAKIRALIDAKP